jgi:isopenicillin N synthase-like dioxygenase
MAVEHTIPLIDISPFLDPSATQNARDTVIKTISEAAQVYGFFQLAGHGIPISLQREILKCAETFFALPQEEKSALHMSNAMVQSNRGYEKIGGQTLQDNARPDLKEVCNLSHYPALLKRLTWIPTKGIYFGEDVPADDPRAGRFLQGPNQWPKLPRDEFHARIMDYRKRLLDLSCVLLQIIAEGLPYGPDIFDDFVVDAVGNVRLLHYHPRSPKMSFNLEVRVFCTIPITYVYS